MTDCLVFDPKDLLPEAWGKLGDPGPVWLFNRASCAREADGYSPTALSARHPAPHCGLPARRWIQGGAGLAGALHRLCSFSRQRPAIRSEQRLVCGSALYRAFGKLWLYWNSGWHDPFNHQFVQELAGSDLRPIGVPRELVLQGNGARSRKIGCSSGRTQAMRFIRSPRTGFWRPHGLQRPRGLRRDHFDAVGEQ